jgi:hypothetical protein
VAGCTLSFCHLEIQSSLPLKSTYISRGSISLENQG